jgi:hypothetical protein
MRLFAVVLVSRSCQAVLAQVAELRRHYTLAQVVRRQPQDFQASPISLTHTKAAACRIQLKYPLTQFKTSSQVLVSWIETERPLKVLLSCPVVPPCEFRLAKARVGVKWMMWVLTSAMVLDHLSIGGRIVYLAFAILFGGIVFGLCLAVGLGSKDLISRSLEREASRSGEEIESPFRHM